MLTWRLWFLGLQWVQSSSYFQSSSGLRTADALRFSNYLSPCYHQKMSACALSHHVLPLQEGPASSRIRGTPKCKWPTEHDGDGGGGGLPPAESGQCLGITTDSFQRAQGFCPLDCRLHCGRVPRSVLRYYRSDACHHVTLPHSLAAPEIKWKWAFIVAAAVKISTGKEKIKITNREVKNKTTKTDFQTPVCVLFWPLHRSGLGPHLKISWELSPALGPGEPTLSILGIV